jgi:hypothetical protein
MVRNRTPILELKALRGGRSQLTGASVASGLGDDLTEGHQLRWLCRNGSDAKETIVIIFRTYTP